MYRRILAVLALFATALVAPLAAPATAAPAPAAAEDTRLCHHPTWGGTYYCKYGYETFTLPNGTIYFVVVNINYQVWARWRNPSGTFSAWTSLGGQVWHGNPDGNTNDLTQARCGDEFAVIVRGTDRNFWYRVRHTDGSWTPNWRRTPVPCG